MPGHARDTVAVSQVSPIRSFVSGREVREQNVTSQVECDRVISYEAAGLHFVDFNPPAM